MSEDMIRAAAKSCNTYAVHLIQGYDDTFPHEFTPEFQSKIQKLKRRADHPKMYYFLQRVASIAIAILFAGSVWLMVDTDVRATFFNWIKETYENYFVYRYTQNTSEGVDISSYFPTWIPDGYSDFYTTTTSDTKTVIFADEEGRMLKFIVSSQPNETDLFVDTTNTTITQTMVNQCSADLFISDNPEIASAIMWTNADQSAFYISGFLKGEELIRMADSVGETKK